MAEKGVPVVWAGLDEMPVSPANAFLSQFQGDTFFLSFGLVSPPILWGTEEQRAKQLDEMSPIPVRPVARAALTYEDMKRLVAILRENLRSYETRQEGS